MYEASDLTGGTTMYNETTGATNLTGGTNMETTTKNALGGRGSMYGTAFKIGAATGLGAGLVGIALDLGYRAYLNWKAKKEDKK